MFSRKVIPFAVYYVIAFIAFTLIYNAVGPSVYSSYMFLLYLFLLGLPAVVQFNNTGQYRLYIKLASMLFALVPVVMYVDVMPILYSVFSVLALLLLVPTVLSDKNINTDLLFGVVISLIIAFLVSPVVAIVIMSSLGMLYIHDRFFGVDDDTNRTLGVPTSQ